MPENDLLLESGTRLLHIGPPKTGTTALQGALMQARTDMAALGVVYPGSDRQHWRAARAAVGARRAKGGSRVDPKWWDLLVEQVGAAGERRVIVSAEGFAHADESGVRKVTTALGGSRVHVVVTLRPLAKVLPSAYQQFVRKGLRLSYERWLAQTLGTHREDGDEAFWQRHRHDLLVARWAAVVGADNLTAVVVDDSDRMMVMRAFEQLLGLPLGLLKPDGQTNPSLTFGEIELVRQLNVEFHRRGWSRKHHRAMVGKGLVPHLLYTDRRTAYGRRIQTPSWAAEYAASIGRATAEGIAASGVRVVGDISTLAWRPDETVQELAPRARVPSRVATQAVVATILATTPGSSEMTGPKNTRVPKASARRTRRRRAPARRRALGPLVPAGQVLRRRSTGGNRRMPTSSAAPAPRRHPRKTPEA